MRQIQASLTDEDAERLERILRDKNLTSYAFVRDTILREIRLLETNTNHAKISPLVEEMVAALRERKWHLYQLEDYSDHNHKAWIETRFRKATKSELADAITLFRTKAVP